MATISNTPRPGYVYDSTDAVWYPIGTGTHSHSEIASTIVDAKGDIITATAADTPARLAVGNNGDTLVADSAATTGLRWEGNYAAGKNKIINGDFGVWQRGTTFTNPTSGAYTADRFVVQLNNSCSYTITRQTFTPGTAPVAGYEGSFFLRYDRTTAGTTTFLALSQRVEDVRTFAGETVTLSFWAKASSAVSLTTEIGQNFGSGGSSFVSVNNTANSVTTAWQRFTITTSMTSISGKTIGTGSFAAIDFYPPQTTTAQIDIWGVQFEAGSVATAFQTATGTLQGELAACQRYYYASDQTVIWSGNVTTANNYYLTTYYPIPMRVSPTVTTTNTGGANFAAGNPSTTVVGKFSFWAFLGSNGTGVGNYQFSYTATAEL